MAAHGETKVDLRLTSNDEQTIETMLKRREGVIGDNCTRDNKHRQAGDKGEGAYKGPGCEPIVSSVSRQVFIFFLQISYLVLVI